MADYRYHPLDVQAPAFRLLKLQRSNTAKIECEMFHSQISEHNSHAYEALSYAWGNAELVETIEVNGQRLWITDNLYSALQCLRSLDKDRILWIDAICINQSDKAEQSQQVLQMGNIFSFATRVVIWLGKPTAEVILLMKSLNELQMKVVASSQRGIAADSTTWKTLWLGMQQIEEAQNSIRLAKQRRGLETLLKRPWFERVWILQEVLNARTAIVCSGSFTVSADVFAFSPLLFDLTPEQHVQSVLDLMPGPTEAYPRCSRGRDTLINLLNKFRASEATDARDMIFALLGMSSEPLDHELLLPNYTKPLQEVFQSTLRYWFEATMVTFPQVLYCLAGLKNIRVTYLIPLQRTLTRKRVKPLPFKPDTIPCITDPSLFAFEQVRGDFSRQQYTLYAEIEQLQLKMENEPSSMGIPYNDSLGFTSWHFSQQTAKFLIVYDIVRALILVILHEYSQVFKFIAENGTDDTAKLLSEAVCQAAEDGFSNAVQRLLEEGADVSLQVGEYGNALQTAAYFDRLDVVKLLLEKGISVNLDGGSYGTALHAASTGASMKVLHLLLENGADVNARGGRYDSALQVISGGFNNGTRDLKMMRLLLEYGADVNAQGGYFGTALQAASFYGRESIVQLLFEYGADANAQGGRYGNALQAASFQGREHIMKQLLEKGADIDAEGGHFNSALQAASSGNHMRIVKTLLDKGVDVNTQGKQFDGALQAASAGDYTEMTQLLIDKREMVNDEEWCAVPRTPSPGEYAELIQLLLEEKAKATI